VRQSAFRIGVINGGNIHTHTTQRSGELTRCLTHTMFGGEET
jgi:hypothetical protein